MQCWTNVEDVGTTLYKCYTNVLCLLGRRTFSQTLYINSMLVQCWASVADVGLALDCPRHARLAVESFFNADLLNPSGRGLSIPTDQGNQISTIRDTCMNWCTSGSLSERGWHHGNIATEGSPKPGLCPTLISNDFKGSL